MPRQLGGAVPDSGTIATDYRRLSLRTQNFYARLICVPAGLFAVFFAAALLLGWLVPEYASVSLGIPIITGASCLSYLIEPSARVSKVGKPQRRLFRYIRPIFG